MRKKLKRGKRTGLVYFGYANIKSWSPCYDPVKHIPATWRGTAVDILNLEQVPVPDRLWVVCREEIVSAKTLRLFAVWCARQVQHLMKDPRSIAALDVAERFANGEATEAERAAARDAAGAAAWDAAWAAAWAAAGDAAWGAARSAAWGAARSAARAAARDAAGDVAGAAARDAQVAKLIEMVRAEGRQARAGKDGGSDER